MSEQERDVSEELALMEQAEVLIDGVADSPLASEGPQSAAEDSPSLHEPSYPISPASETHPHDEPSPVADPQPSHAPSAQIIARAPAAEATHDATLARQASADHFTVEQPKRRVSRLYTTPANAGTPNYGRVLSFSEEEARDKHRVEQRAEQRQSITRGSSQPQQPPAKAARRASRLEDSVPRGPAPNYGTVLRFDGKEKRTSAKPHARGASLNATTTTTATTLAPTPTNRDGRSGAAPSPAEQAKHVDRLSRPRQQSAAPHETSPAPNLIHAHKPPARTSSLSHTNRLAEPRKRDVPPAESVISAPPHLRRATSATPVNQESVNRLSQPRQRRASLTRDPLLARAREDARRSHYGGTTPISLPPKAPAASDPTPPSTPLHGKKAPVPVSWADMKPAPRASSALAGRASQPTTPRGPHRSTITPPLSKPTAGPSAGAPAPTAAASGARPAAACVVVSQAAAPAATAAATMKKDDAAEMPAPPLAVRAKRRADLDGPSEGSHDNTARPPLSGAAAPTSATTPPPQAAVVYAAKRKTAAPTAPPSPPTPPSPPSPVEACVEPVAAQTRSSEAPTGLTVPVIKSVPARVSIKKRPPPSAVVAAGANPNRASAPQS